MNWYWIVAIIMGSIIMMYFTGLLVYIYCCKNMGGINLLDTTKDTVMTEKGLLDVKGTKTNFLAFSVVAGALFPLTIIVVIIVLLLELLEYISSPITKFVIDKLK